jgi:hypothetical protein
MIYSINDTQHNNTLPLYCHYADCRIVLNVMLNNAMLNVVMLSVIMLGAFKTSTIGNCTKYVAKKHINKFLLLLFFLI